MSTVHINAVTRSMQANKLNRRMPTSNRSKCSRHFQARQIIFLLIFLLLQNFLIGEEIISSAEAVVVGPIVADNTLEKCKADLVQAGGERVDPLEYTDFIQLFSNGEIEVSEFQNLPLDLIRVFNLSSCRACEALFEPSDPIPCCEGGERYIETKDETEQDELYLFHACSMVDDSVRNHLGQTDAPTMNPTVEPTSKPTSSPSTKPSISPSGAPTPTPTAVPTFMPSVVPSAGPSSAEPTSTPSTFPSFTPSASPNSSPSSAPSSRPSLSPSGTPSQSPSSIPSQSPSTGPSQQPSTPAPTRFGFLEVRISYGIRTDGIDAVSLMTGRNPENTLKQDLVSSTAATIVQTLDELRRRRRLLSSTGEFKPTPSQLRREPRRLSGNGGDDGRNLATYHPDTPVQITSVLDDTCWYPPPETPTTLCLYIRSVVSVFLDRDDNPDDVREAIMAGLQKHGIPLPEYAW